MPPIGLRDGVVQEAVGLRSEGLLESARCERKGARMMKIRPWRDGFMRIVIVLLEIL